MQDQPQNPQANTVQEKGLVPSFVEIRRVLRELPGPDLEAGTAARARDATLTKPAGALGRLEDLSFWMSCWQGAHPPRLHRPRVAIFAANHGVAAQGVSAFPPSVTKEMVQNFVQGGAAVNQLCTIADADLRVYELDLDSPSGDITETAAMDETECAKAMTYGMMAVEPGLDLLCLGEMGIGNTTIAAALCHALYGGAASDWTGPGTGVTGPVLEAKTAAVAKAVAHHQPAIQAAGGDPFEILRRLGGLEIAAMAGAILAARMARIPVLLDGYVSGSAAAIIHALDRTALGHCQISHLSPEPGHRLLAEKLGLEPLLDLGLRLGEGSGAALAINIVKAAVACHCGMASFEDAGVSGPGA